MNARGTKIVTHHNGALKRGDALRSAFFGIVDEAADRPTLEHQIGSWQSDDALAPLFEHSAIHVEDGIVLTVVSRVEGGGVDAPVLIASEDSSIRLLFGGRIFNHEQPRQGPESKRVTPPTASAHHLLQRYQRQRDDFLHDANGTFAFALWDCQSKRLMLGRDHLGIEPLYYTQREGKLFFATSPGLLKAIGAVDGTLNPAAVFQYLLYCYNPATETIFKSVHRLPAAHVLVAQGSACSLRRYWTPSFADPMTASESQIKAEFLELMEDAIRIRLDKRESAGAFLSGGTDSSAIVSIAAALDNRLDRTFSYRCSNLSYDESEYAQFIASQYGTNHQEVPYTAADLGLLPQAVRWMDEPFCDIGIEVATFLLGRAAEGSISCAFTGHGGDELFAGHPVYAADKAAALVDWVPGTLTAPVLNVFQRLPDSHRKADWKVKLKRFAYSLSFPPALLSQRWRVHYTPAELADLCTDEFLHECNLSSIYEPILRHAREADGPDALSRSLYADLHTLVEFYHSRLSLLRAFSIQPRLPLLDHRLVTYAARIPSRLKLRGFSKDKYIYRKLLEPVLSRRILYDRPKLGNSIPVKNWIRDDPATREWLLDTLSSQAFQGRGWFRTAKVKQMIDEHFERRHNRSHRLWGLLVLETWLAAHRGG